MESNECEVVNISREGMAIRFFTHELIDVGSCVVLKINVPNRLHPVSSVVSLRWLETLDDGSGYS